jgi:anti-anti-sigma regulatory factor
MNLIVSQAQGQVPVTVLSVQGDLDGSNYQTLIAKVKALYQSGVRHLILDMSACPYMSSSGLVAIHSASLLMRGDQPPDPQHGWAAFHAIAEEESAVQANVKLLNLQPKVDRTLEMAGMKEFFGIFSDLDAAVASF